jgi:hypothetical protein
LLQFDGSLLKKLGNEEYQKGGDHDRKRHLPHEDEKQCHTDSIDTKSEDHVDQREKE